MIFTSIAAAALAAVTGMTTIRTPGGIQRQFNEKPNFAIELTVADFSDPKTFEKAITLAIDNIPTRGPKINQNSAENAANRTAKNILTNFKNGMIKTGFIPEQIRYYNVYNVEEVGMKMSERKIVNVLDHSVITFVDKFGETVSFVDDNYSKHDLLFDDKGASRDYYKMNSGAVGGGNQTFKTVWKEVISTIGIQKYEHAIAYTKADLLHPGDAWIPEPIEWGDIVSDTMSNNKIDILNGLQNVLLERSVADEINILKEYRLETYANMASTNSVLAGYSMNLALDDTEIAAGGRMLDRTMANAAVQEALDLDFASLMSRNDLNIVY